MATAKTTTLTFRIEPDLKEALRTAADRENRSIANMIEVVRDAAEKYVADQWPALKKQLEMGICRIC